MPPPVSQSPAARDVMVLRGPADEELMHVESIRRVGDELVIKDKNFGTLPTEARLDGAATRTGLKMLSAKDMAFLSSLPFRKAKQP